MQTNIVLIEDDKDISEFLRQVLVDHGYEASTASTGVSGLELIKKVSPELILLDLNLPDISGETVCNTVKKTYPQIKVIMITAKDTPEDLARGLNLGADDYIAKPIAVEELIARIQTRMRTGADNKEKIQVADLVLNLKTHEVKRGDHLITLSAQEFKLLHYLMSNPNRVLTREVILSRIWGMAVDVETRVVDVYIGYLRKKIDRSFSEKLIHSVRGFGYILRIPKDKPLSTAKLSAPQSASLLPA